MSVDLKVSQPSFFFFFFSSPKSSGGVAQLTSTYHLIGRLGDHLVCKTSKYFQGSISFDSSDSEPKPLAECNCILDYSGKNTSNSSPASTAADSPNCPSYLDRPGGHHSSALAQAESLNFHATSPDHGQRSTHWCLCTT